MKPRTMPRTMLQAALAILAAAVPATAALALAAWLLAGCAVEVQNVKPAQELDRASALPGSASLGWRVFQDKCARCHGDSATGPMAEQLLSRVRELGPRRFVNLVLRRYEWTLPADQAGTEGAAREALVEAMLRREAGAVTMPAWEGEPRVQAHIADLYAYLAARAEGTQGPGRPVP